MLLRAAFMTAALGLGVSGLSLAASQRVDRIIDTGWKFVREDPAGAERNGFNDAHWEIVTLPHTWNARDGQDGGNDYYRGTGWYRKRLRIEGPLDGKSVLLKFDAAATKTRAFVNGHEVGSHNGNFGAFCFDITSFVKPDAENLIAVRVNNARDSSIAPLSGDFTVFGGIYRNIHLLILNDVSISPLDHASSGVYVTQKEVTRDQARAYISTLLRNSSPLQRIASLRLTLFDADGKRVAGRDSTVTLDPHASSTVIQEISLPHPHLWHGRKDPYLYSLLAEVVDRGKILDGVEVPVGFRFFSVDPEKGFFLNGEPYPLHGVNRHHDRLNKGWAIGPSEHREDYTLIEELGCTAVRLAHYQHAQEFYDLCDRGGMIVWAELALVDVIHLDDAFAANCREQLTELIKQNYNHPSIVIWSMENELIPGNHAGEYGNFVHDLHTLAKQLDPSRLTTVASRGDYDGSQPMNAATDLIGYNLYLGWYESRAEEFGVRVDGLHRRFPLRPMCISEYGAGAGTTQHEQPPRKPQPGGRWHPEEWQTLLHETTWPQIAARPFLWGSFVWNMFDFAVDARSEGEIPGRNDKGLVTYDRKIRKDAFFYYKAQWNPSPMVYIASRRFTPRPAGIVEVEVFSNCARVGLTVNGADMGEKEGSDKIFRWSGVELKPGKNVVRATGIEGGRTCKDVVTWEAELQTPERTGPSSSQ